MFGTYSIDYTVILLILVFIFFIYNYKIVLSKVTNNFKYLVFLNRIIVLILLVLIFIDPTLLLTNKNTNVSIIIDDSKSMSYNLKKINLKYDFLVSKIDNWVESNNITPKFFSFSESFESIQSLSNIKFEGNYTDFGNMLKSVNDNSIIISDGAYNYGISGLSLDNVNKLNIIGVGEEKEVFDVSLTLLESFVYNDSVEFKFQISSNSLKPINNNIYISNSIYKSYPILSYNVDAGYIKINKSIKLSKEMLTENNIFYIDNLNDEISTHNNTLFYTLDDKFLDKNPILFISGGISNNTKFIKNNILYDFQKHRIDHIYRLDKNIWNEDIKSIDLKSYNIIILDNFPYYSEDDIYFDTLLNNLNNKLIYFSGPHNNRIKQTFFEDFDCQFNLNESKLNDQIEVNHIYNGVSYVIPPIEKNYTIICANPTLIDSDNNSIIYNQNNRLLLFIDDLMLFDTNFKKINNNLYFLKKYFDDFIYEDNKYLKLYTTEDTYQVNDTLNLYLELNDSFEMKDIYIDILENNTNIYKKLKNYTILGDNLLIFKYVIDKPSEFTLQAYANISSETVNSNLVNIFTNISDNELSYIYLNKDFLSELSINTGGIYSSVDKIDYLLDNIEFSDANNVNYRRYNMDSYPYLFLLIIVLLSIEWYFRNKMGLI